MNKKFFSGLLTGLCTALLIFAVYGFVTVYVQSKTEDSDNKSFGKVKDQQTSEEKEAEEVPYDEIVEKLEFLQMLVDKYYLDDVKEISFSDGIYKGFIKSLEDPYSTYFTEKEYKALMESSSGVYCGIGATVSQDAKTGIITIVKPFATGPAYKAGILPGDVIYKVNEEEVTGVDLTEVVSRMKGVEGTTVNISIVREDESNPLEFSIKRQKIEVPTIEYQMLDSKIGFITIVEFDEVTVEQFKKAVNDLEKKGMKGLIVDVRNNPGGLLDSVVKILDRLLPPGLIVYTEDKYKDREEENAVDKAKINVPMVVLINGQSASAAEIFAGTLQDYETATIVGTTSFGKGIVQKVIPLSDGTAVKLTISKYYTPKGRNIHGTGIVPDVEIDLVEDMKKEIVIPLDKDNQLQEAIKVIKQKIK